MASFESKVSEIFDENPKLARKTSVVIRKIFNESEFEFKRRLKKETEDMVQTSMLRLFDILFIDFYFDTLENHFLSWVIDKHADRFTEPELEEMRAQSLSHLDFYEVQKILPGKGCYLKSLFTKNESFLKDISSSSKLVKWDIILSRCYFFHGCYYATGSVALFDPAKKQFIISHIEKTWSDYRDYSGISDYADFAKNHWDIFSKMDLEIKKKVANKKYYSKYGEMLLCEVRFRVQDLHAILKKIDFCEEFNFIETKKRRDKKKKGSITRHQYDWLTLGIEEELESIKTGQIDDGFIFFTSQLDVKGNQTGIEVLGTLYIDQLLCRLEIRSLELAEFAVNHFNHLFGNALKFKRILTKTIDSALNQKTNEETVEPAQPTQSNHELTGKYLEKYYLGLLDEKIPALNNMSPREARQDSSAYSLLIEWLKGLENIFERNRINGKQSFSIEKIKKELDINW